MKTAFSLLVLIATIGLAHAGGLGGPPPFTNGSPLLSGVDGTYSANVTAQNTVGVIRFTFADNVQTSSFVDNSYTIFSEGLVFNGANQVNIILSEIAGVLERDSGQAFENTALTGYFTAKLQTNDPFGSFRGKGVLQFFIEDAANPGIFLNFFSKNVKIKGVRSSTG